MPPVALGTWTSILGFDEAGEPTEMGRCRCGMPIELTPGMKEWAEAGHVLLCDDCEPK